jgi:hypothetical protein
VLAATPAAAAQRLLDRIARRVAALDGVVLFDIAQQSLLCNRLVRNQLDANSIFAAMRSPVGAMYNINYHSYESKLNAIEQ